ncbi:hypothetical protein A3F00_03065 [Candidatus Daviesbacteria bacterium RIFCSPHIGHO2_12_FULL_37_11]|uniref:DUF4012 domain-containing protein n=1 Tax=Candidatus Daviesbacteria bacterium RIFCSPHIGHO2_12_FULL_37_11 TaxID=1797777 RepID=A0A1F5KBL4_9BACT|nr:MAG: hypothetical protein A2769_04355 [Candidatus Daviesbacteria bacterium RIFCSPHIGHO2_01_FULL_37_27]OGE38279.1 MAG: hypothetical protein A3F00_03065 [Candidatus Daviesbacteria bacterium RIFCSPHIGHO2_12_FULL_37_11]OGE46235.1 MAG: hypothetical protein A3B39_02830 [Candidatus Daviesbacteria bacterium RIFCSPLOWO2_01_FULL_37_10]
MLNLNKKIDYKYNSYSRKHKFSGKIFFRIFFIFVFIAIIIGIPLKFAYDGVKEVGVHGQAIASAYQSQNFGQIVTETEAAGSSLKKIDTSLNFLVWLRLIPVVGGYFGDIKSLTSASVDELSALNILFSELKPYEKELGFLGQTMAGQDRITQAIKILEKSYPIFPKMEKNLKSAKEKVEEIDESKYTEEFRGIRLRDFIRTLKNFYVGVYIATTVSKDALEIAPAALGQTSTKNYLLLFQNDKEIRATGGFLTAYAFLKIDKGQINATVSDDIYRLDERLLGTCQSKICPLKPPAPIAKYLPEVDGKERQAWSMRDSNLSPDLATSAKEFERMYGYLGQGLPFDGIIYIDSQVVEELIEVTGEIDIFGTPYSAKLDHRCNCPNVIYELESYAEIASKGEQDRKAILGVLMQQMLVKLIGADTEKIPQFLETIVRLANHKHIMFYMHDGKTQDSLAKLNWTGKIKSFDGDYLHINDSNFAGGKSNIYLEEKVTQEIKVSSGKVTKKITVEYKNPQKHDTWLNGINRSYVRFYVPLGSKLVSSKGSDNPVTTIEDLDKTVFEAFVVTRPENSRKLEIEYEIPYKPSGEYNLMVQKQPGAKDFEYIIKINGSTKENFKLDQDREFKFDI